MSDLQPHVPARDAWAPEFQSASCARCAAPLPELASFCQWCGQPTFGPVGARPVVMPGAAGRSQVPVAAVPGRARTAGRCIVAGAGGIVVSTFLPWFSWLGVVGATVPFASFLVLAALGVLVGYLGVRVLKGRANRVVMVILWVVAVLAVLFIGGVVDATDNVNAASYGSVTPSVGLYLVVLGLAATVLGTALLQTTRRRSRQH